MWRKWNCKEYICSDCAIDKSQEPFERAYDAGLDVGYEKGFEDAQRG